MDTNLINCDRNEKTLREVPRLKGQSGAEEGSYSSAGLTHMPVRPRPETDEPGTEMKNGANKRGDFIVMYNDYETCYG